MSWFRSWAGAPTDPKWLLIAKRANVAPGIVSAVVWALLDHASEATDRGSVASFDVETYAIYSGFDEDKVRAILAALEAKGVIVDGRFAQWEKRQPKREDDSGARVARHRSRKPPDAEPSLPLEPPSAPPPAPANSARESDMPPSEPDPDPVVEETVAAIAGAPSPAAIELADEVARAAGHDLEFVPPAWCGAAIRVEMWLARGWSPPLILQSVKAQMARKRDGPPATIRYFEKGIAQAHASGEAPLPIVQPIEQDVVHAKIGNSSGGFGVVSAALRASDDAGRAYGSNHLRLVDRSDDS